MDWLGFKIDWESTPDNSPIYLQISLGKIVIHLTGHQCDCSPGSRIHIEDFKGLKEFHKSLLAKEYVFNSPSIDKAFYNSKVNIMQVTDPFGNRLTFTEKE